MRTTDFAVFRLTDMCGRYGFGNPARLNELNLGVSFPPMDARFNVAPTQPVPLVLNSRTGERVVTMARWGLVPFWADDPAVGSRMINARGDTVRTKPAFKDAFQRRRALMPADLFYEWQQSEGTRYRQPWCIRMPDDAPFVFGALWDRWKPQDSEKDAEWLISCTVVTTEPNAVMKPIHDRMPLIIPAEHRDAWLDPSTSEDDAYSLIKPYEGEMIAYQVGRLVNSPNNEDPQCIASMSDEERDSPERYVQGGLFG